MTPEYWKSHTPPCHPESVARLGEWASALWACAECGDFLDCAECDDQSADPHGLGGMRKACSNCDREFVQGEP